MKYTFSNKLDSLSLVLHKTLKTLEQRDVRNSKLLLSNLSSVKYLKGTRTAVLNVVISVKIQEKTQEEIQKKKKNDSQQQKQQNLQRQYIQQHFLRELNSGQDQPQVEHETKPNARPQNSKESTSRKKLKTLKSRKFKQKHIRKSLYELFGFWKYSIP